ncbi:MAG TPA: c-type cytochrome [Burkholderiales bacterium]
MRRWSSAFLALLAAACGDDQAPALGGNPEQGKLLLRQFACTSCHTIPGVAGGDGKVGPPLTGVAGRIYLAGVLPNTPQTMASFVRYPQKADPKTAMPDMGVTEEQARDMVAYLYQLK